MPPDVVCRITQSQPPLRTRASHRFYHNLNLSPQRTSPPGCAGFQPACRGARAFSSHAGGAGFQLACRERGRLARIQRCAPSPLHRMGAQASSPHAGSAGVSPAYSDTPPGYAGFQPASGDMPRGCAGVQPACRERGLPARLQRYATWVRRRPARMPGARASSLPQRYAPPGCAGVQPACWERGRLARIQRYATWVCGLPARIQRYTPSPLHRMGARASSPHAGCTGIAPAYSDTPHHPCTAWVRGRLARMPRAEGHTWQRQWVLDHALTS